MKTYTDTLTYAETEKGNALIYEGKSIPKVLGNRDYDEYLERVDQGKAITEAYVAPDITLDVIRAERDRLLDDYDLRQINAEKWDTLTAQQKSDASTYKQALRDLPDVIDVSGVKTLADALDQFPIAPAL